MIQTKKLFKNYTKIAYNQVRKHKVSTKGFFSLIAIDKNFQRRYSMNSKFIPQNCKKRLLRVENSSVTRYLPRNDKDLPWFNDEVRQILNKKDELFKQLTMIKCNVSVVSWENLLGLQEKNLVFFYWLNCLIHSH